MKLNFWGIGELEISSEKRDSISAPVQFARSAIKLGHSGGIISQLGRDSLGEQTLNQLSSEGIDTSGILLDPRLSSVEAPDHLEFTATLREKLTSADAIYFSIRGRRHPVASRSIGFLVTLAPAKTIRILEFQLGSENYERDLILDSIRRADVIILDETERIRTCQLLDIPNDQFVFAQIVSNMIRKRMILIRENNHRLTLYQEGKYTPLIVHSIDDLPVRIALSLVKSNTIEL